MSLIKSEKAKDKKGNSWACLYSLLLFFYPLSLSPTLTLTNPGPKQIANARDKSGRTIGKNNLRLKATIRPKARQGQGKFKTRPRQAKEFGVPDQRHEQLTLTSP